MSELKPCPFCGGEAEAQMNGPLSGRQYWEIACLGCDFVAHDRTEKAAAMEAWNRRAALEGDAQPVADLAPYYCTDCENHIRTLHEGRCSCGSGRVVATPPSPTALSGDRPKEDRDAAL